MRDVLRITMADLLTEICEKTGASKQTVAKRLIGEPVKGAAGRFVDQELRARGIEPGVFASLSPKRELP